MGVNSRTLSAKRTKLPARGMQRLSLDRVTMAGGVTDAADRAAGSRSAE
jgi:hypothetical protein